jgi:hypothetical protein
MCLEWRPEVGSAGPCIRHDRHQLARWVADKAMRIAGHLLSFPKVRCRLYVVTFGFASAIRPMPATFAAEYKISGGFE